jgi:periplasmic protein TonB
MPEKRRTMFSVVASCSAQIAIVGLLLIVPLVYTQRLPKGPRANVFLPPLPQQREIAEPLRRDSMHRASSGAVRPFAAVLIAPARTPEHVLLIDDSNSAPPLPSGGTPLNGLGGLGPGVPGSIGRALYESPQPPPERSPQAASNKPIQVGGDVQRGKLLRQPLPVYPPIARQTRVSGVVRLIGIVGKDGTIEQLRVVSGHPLLVRSALDAVSQWIYRPTLLNGQPVEVIAPIDVHFKLN